MLQMILLLLLHCSNAINADCNIWVAGTDHKNASVGGHVTLPCTNLIKQTTCSNTTWMSEKHSAAFELVTLGNINQANPDEERRISLTPNCSLHISNIRAEDCGCYLCQQWMKNKRVKEDARFCLFITKEDNDRDGIDLEIVIPSVLLVIALLVAVLIVWLRYRRRAHERTSPVNENNVSNERSGEDVMYTELNHNTVKPREVYKNMGHQETVYVCIKPC